MKNRTSTKSFGTPTRSNHDSRKFYSRRMFSDTENTVSEGLTTDQPVSEANLNQVYCHSSEAMRELPDRSVHMVVTSPPYNVGKEYDDDLSVAEYEALLSRVFTECYRVLTHGGRACINVANVGRKPYIPFNGLISSLMIEIGYLMRGEIIWNKAASAGTSCAWGSWMSPSNPVLRDVHEYILVFSKESFRRSTEKQPSITKEDFLESTKSVWNFPAESAKKVGHPAPFPVELPRRLLELYTYEGDIVLDPFMGSGSTALACVQNSRRWVGYDTSEEYCDITRHRLDTWRADEPLFNR